METEVFLQNSSEQLDFMQKTCKWAMSGDGIIDWPLQQIHTEKIRLGNGDGTFRAASLTIAGLYESADLPMSTATPNWISLQVHH